MLEPRQSLPPLDFNDAAAGHGTNFNVPAGDYANGGLIGQPASAPTASQWQNTSSTVNPITVAGNNGTASGNGSVTLTNNGEDDRLPFTAPVTSGSVYM